MWGGDKVGRAAEFQPLGAHVYAARGQLVHLAQQHGRVDHGPIADEADDARMDNAGGMRWSLKISSPMVTA